MRDSFNAQKVISEKTRSLIEKLAWLVGGREGGGYGEGKRGLATKKKNFSFAVFELWEEDGGVECVERKGMVTKRMNKR